ncbi:hypothetical protein SDC9_158991 [bioreactor metagenome]|uniref:4-hydroxy-tetrahydrodipicolinate synthase n=2 Tax=root TaxID=1 RepID=A0A645FGS0_9ZZZZ
MGRPVGGFRLPLVELAPNNRQTLSETLAHYGLLAQGGA